MGASQVAARQQTTPLERSTARPRRRRPCCSQAQAGSGVVEQLQLIAQMIGITNSELIVLNQTLSTTGPRAHRPGGAQAASEKQLSLGKSDDARAGYTDKGVPVAVPTTLP